MIMRTISGQPSSFSLTFCISCSQSWVKALSTTARGPEDGLWDIGITTRVRLGVTEKPVCDDHRVRFSSKVAHRMSKLSMDDSKYAKLFYHAIKLDRDILQISPKPILGNYTRPKVEAQKPLPTAQREDRNSSHTYRDKPSNPTYLSGVCFGCNSHVHPLSRCPIIGDLISRGDLTKIRGMIALPSGEIIRRNPTESFAEAFHRIKQEMLRSKSNFILTNDVHYCWGFTYYIIPDRDTQEPVDIDDDEDYYDNVLSDYYEYDNEDNNLSDYEDEHRELDEVWIYAAERQQKDTRSFWHQVMDGVYIPSWKRSGNEFQTSKINLVHNKPRYALKGKNKLQKENIPPPREFWVWSTTDPPMQQADRMILRQGEWPLESKNEMVTRQNVKTVDVPMKVLADAWPRQPRTYPTTSATPQSREQGARGSRDVEMRDETKEGRTGKKEERSNNTPVTHGPNKFQLQSSAAWHDSPVNNDIKEPSHHISELTAEINPCHVVAKVLDTPITLTTGELIRSSPKLSQMLSDRICVKTIKESEIPAAVHHVKEIKVRQNLL